MNGDSATNFYFCIVLSISAMLVDFCSIHRSLVKFIDRNRESLCQKFKQGFEDPCIRNQRQHNHSTRYNTSQHCQVSTVINLHTCPSFCSFRKSFPLSYNQNQNDGTIQKVITNMTFVICQEKPHILVSQIYNIHEDDNSYISERFTTL